jgi:hypothetical protein
MQEVEFERVLSVLHGWLGQSVSIGVEVTVQPLQVAHMRGGLAAAHDIAAPYDEAEFEFTVGADAGFGLRRDYFHGAALFAASGRLIVSLLDDFEDPEERVGAIVHIVGPPL